VLKALAVDIIERPVVNQLETPTVHYSNLFFGIKRIIAFVTSPIIWLKMEFLIYKNKSLKTNLTTMGV
jgi:hypothetical protein